VAIRVVVEDRMSIVLLGLGIVNLLMGLTCLVGGVSLWWGVFNLIFGVVNLVGWRLEATSKNPIPLLYWRHPHE